MPIRHTITQEEIANFQKDIVSLIPTLELLDFQVVVTDLFANILYINKAGQRKLGYSQEEAIGKNIGDLWGGHESSDFFANMWDTIKKDKKPFISTLENWKKDGTVIHQEIHISPIFDTAGELRYYLSSEPEFKPTEIEQSALKKQISTLVDASISGELKIAALKEEVARLKSRP